MYTFWKRAAPPASMDIFNAPTREACTVRRERTNTPLQALVTLNDPQFVEAARQPGPGRAPGRRRQDRREPDRPHRPAAAGPAAAAGGEPLGPGHARRAAAHYKADPAGAKELLAVGQSKADPALDPPTLAAWTMLANELMNLDEVLNK